MTVANVWSEPLLVPPGLVAETLKWYVVFPPRTGRRQYECKVSGGTLGGAVKRANANLAEAELPPLARGEDVQAQIRAVIEGAQFADIGSRGEHVPMEQARGHAA